MEKTNTNTKITGITVRDLLESERALEILSSRGMEEPINYRIAKVMRKAAPEIKQFRKGLQERIEGTKAFLRDDQGIKLDPDKPDFEKHLAAIEKNREAALDESTELTGGVGTIKLSELMEALPKRNLGTEAEPKWVRALLEPWILANLMWLIEE